MIVYSRPVRRSRSREGGSASRAVMLSLSLRLVNPALVSERMTEMSRSVDDYGCCQCRVTLSEWRKSPCVARAMPP
ncbi:hypothetical protein IE81DRAFT_42618 [Ceraceosorus guamensis]|uniref:Uncharacterized protein n=1 Tax=Ceraceosorus guamensis TaxID=1522189 RepID=A0A316VNN6_9BASI|nr:hypothetical protein IE81DRAFT_42618 [Ceraceosorus guamensis]PWN39187.1 hypothetical protein IE81DRAFT_42618 [Ceraceosorus guamensis]